MATRHAVKLTSNFERNLEDLETFFLEAQAPHAFDALLKELTDTVIPNLEMFPGLGRLFMERPSRSAEGATGLQRLSRQLRARGQSGEIREYVMDHHLLLYACIKRTIYLLSIRHQRQLSFDFAALWLTSRSQGNFRETD